ncbi:MAG TPA: M20/M25/M40 family metallo-hydrolase [Phycisphaerales bacterium]|nr:M20/M25/M40 family metallo-hydrolase [Phycisphaerales bacterium]
MHERVLEHLDRDEPRAIERLLEWLRIPSVSTQAEHREDCRRAAQWAARHLESSGLAVRLRETGAVGPDGRGSGHPIVLGFTHEADARAADAEWADGRARARPDAARQSEGPHLLFYGHYDVQPADPLELWDSPPFEPVIRAAVAGGPGERIVARGAVDDKGQVMMFLEALRSWRAVTGTPAGGARFTVLLEGEEESGSVNLDAFCRTAEAMLRRCDACVISDTGMLARTRPAITYGVRGLAYTEVTLHGANQDLHSGLWGGRAPNPASELCKVLARLWDERGRVTLPGFYDAVRPLAPEERAAWARLPFDPAEALAKIGLPPEADRWGGQEEGYTALEREWARPTAEINGIVGGYTGHGAKTIIPARASAKVSFRLVADQDPGAVTEAFFAWCRSRTPPGCRWEFVSHSGGPPATVRTDSEYLRAAARAIKRATGKEPELIRSGGSIPVAGMLKALAGLETVFMGFGLDDDRVHSPNEKFELECYRMGARAHVLLVAEMLGAGRGG